MKHVSLVDFILMLQEEYRARYGEVAAFEQVTFLRDIRGDIKETTLLVMAMADQLKVPVSKGRIHDEFLKTGTYYNVLDLYEEFVRLSTLVGWKNYRTKWWTIGGGVMALSIYCMFQGMPVHGALVAMVAMVGGTIFEQLRGLPRVY